MLLIAVWFGLTYSFVRLKVRGEMFESWIQGAVLKVLWNLLREMRLRSIWDLRKQGRMPLLQGPQELQGRSQVPLMHQYIASSNGISAICAYFSSRTHKNILTKVDIIYVFHLSCSYI